MGGRVIVAVLLMVSPASAQIATDRPTFTHTPHVVEAGSVQVETGIARDPETVSFPQALVRAGLWDRTELRIMLPGVLRHGSTSLVSEAGAAIEYQFMRGAVDAAVLAGVTSRHHAHPTSFVRTMVNRTVAKTTIGGLLGMSRADQLRMDVSAMVIQGISDSWSVFAEGIRSGDTSSNVGLMKTFGSGMQVDAWVGRNITVNAWAYGAGVSVVQPW